MVEKNLPAVTFDGVLLVEPSFETPVQLIDVLDPKGVVDLQGSSDVHRVGRQDFPCGRFDQHRRVFVAQTIGNIGGEVLLDGRAAREIQKPFRSPLVGEPFMITQESTV